MANAPSREALRHWTLLAIEQARLALGAGEAPIGSVIVDESGTVLGAGYNTMVASGNPTLHAEINAFAAAAAREPLDAARGLVLVSSLEPCVMCMGAAMQAGVRTIAHALEAPADAGTRRVSPPSSPGASNPSVVGNLAVTESRALFEAWLAMHAGDASRDGQRAFIVQLLAMTH